MFNLKLLAEKLQAASIEQKALFDMDEAEITTLCESVISSFDETVPPRGWSAPHLDMDSGELVIPGDAHPSYHWWAKGGKSILDSLAELGAPFEVAKKYLDWGDSDMTEQAWRQLCENAF